VPDTIVHLEGGKLTRYAGNYDAFERIRREKLDQQSKLHQRQVAERERIQAFVDRFRAKATKARQAQSRLKMLERMEPIAAVVEESGLTLDFPDPDTLPPPLLALDGAAVGYEGKAVLSGLSLRIDQDDRIGLLGANGNGKSTLIKLLGGELPPLSGTATRTPKLRVGYFAQHQADALSPDGTPFSHMAEKMADAPPAKVRAHLGRFGFGAERADTKVENLSGGEKAKLLMALMAFDAPHIMLLDEPTNHLDVDAREALVQALNAYNGAVVLVSHDPHLMGLVCDRLWLVADGTCRPFDGDMDAYRQHLLDQRRATRGEAEKGEAGTSKKDQRRARAEARAATQTLRKAAREAEKAMERLAAQAETLETRLADPALYDGPPEKVTALQKDLARARGDLEKAEEAWLAAQEDLEAADPA
jgi:ATP-binding cassette subfamily F protein 3